MKKFFVLSMSISVLMMSCGNATDGDASTDTTNFNTTPADTGALSPTYGDTTMKMSESTGTDTTSRPYSGNSTPSTDSMRQQ